MLWSLLSIGRIFDEVKKGVNLVQLTKLKLSVKKNNNLTLNIEHTNFGLILFSIYPFITALGPTIQKAGVLLMFYPILRVYGAAYLSSLLSDCSTA